MKFWVRMALASGLAAVVLAGTGCSERPTGQEQTPPPTPPTVVEQWVAPTLAQADMMYGRGFLEAETQQLYDQIWAQAQAYQVDESFVPVHPVSSATFETVVHYLMDDNPEFYWMWVQYSVDHQGWVQSITLHLQEGLTVAQLQQRMDEIEANAQVFLQDVGEGFDAVVAVHDRLLQAVSYDLSTTLPDTGNIYGGLVQGRGVCDAYSKSFLYLMRQLGIPCIYLNGMGVRGVSHSWNAVFLDGDWYYLDVTWDDAEGKPYSFHDYLLLTQEEIEVDHYPSATQYPERPWSEAIENNYYYRKGYSVFAPPPGEWSTELATAFVNQLQDMQLPQSPAPVYLEVKLMGDFEEYKKGRDYFKDSLFEVLLEMQAQLQSRGLTIQVQTEGSVTYHFNDNTQVLVLMPEVSARKA